MIKLMKYLKKSAGYIVLIIGLLFLQAYCDLSLPDYTSKVINVGIQQGGIPDGVPEKMRQSTMENLQIFMDEDTQKEVQDSYVLDGDTYELKDGITGDKREELNDLLCKPLMMYTSFTSGSEESQKMLSQMQVSEGTDPMQVLSAMPEDAKKQMLEAADEKLSDMPESILTQAAVSGVKAEYEAMDENLDAIQMNYIRTSGIQMVLMALVIMLGLILILFSVALPRFKKMQKLVDRLNLVSREELSGMMVVRAFANQNFMQKRFDAANRDLVGNTLFVNRAMATMMPAMTLVMNGISLLIVWFGGKQIAQSNLQVGDMMAFIQYAMHVIMSFLFISMMFIMVPRASVSAERIYEVLSTENSVKDPSTPKHMEQTKGLVEFKDVSFRYDGAETDVLEHISFTAKPGQTTAFIGSTGSGKSTLINLIPRFYDVSQGSITIDGVDIREIPQQELRDKIGYVPQKGMLFSGTVASNLRYADHSASQQQLEESAQVAQASEFIGELEQGYDTPISQGGTNVSGGQRQRLSIARALVKKAPIYIFDDTFSALDFKTDAKLRKALKGYTEDATVLIVAQRVSTIMHAEQIVVLDEGKVVGIGTHEQLLKECSTYREIAQSQLSKEELA